MDHEGAVRRVVRADVFEPEPLGQIEVELHRRQLPQATDRILDVDVDLRSVEGRFPLHPPVRNAALVQDGDERAFGVRPFLVPPEIVLAGIGSPDGEVHLVLLEPEHPVQVEGEVQARDDLVPDRLRRTEEVSVVLGEPPGSE